MTFRQILNKMQACVSEELTEDDVLDMDIKVTIPTSLNMRVSNVSIKDCYIKTEKRYMNARHEEVPIRTYIALDTNMAT